MGHDIQTPKKILMHVSRLHQFDGTSVDLLYQADSLRKLGYEVFVHARSSSPAITEKIISTEQALHIAKDPSVIVIAHFAGYDRLLHRLRRATRGKFILRYQNVTPSKWFLPYAWRSFLHAFLGRLQAKIFVLGGCVDVLMPASQFNASELLAALPKAFHPKVVVASVLANYDSFRLVGANRLKTTTSEGVRTALYVSRILPHKGVIHLIKLVKAWQETVTTKNGAILNVIVAGKLLPEYKKFLDDLKTKARTLNVSSHISFQTQVSAEDLLNLYRNADIYICTSEHEGFGIPIIEAQCAELAVVALDRGAIKETMGSGGISFPGDPVDYHQLAKVVESVLSDDSYRSHLIQEGVKNTLRFEHEKTMRCVVDAIIAAENTPRRDRLPSHTPA